MSRRPDGRHADPRSKHRRPPSPSLCCTLLPILRTRVWEGSDPNVSHLLRKLRSMPENVRDMAENMRTQASRDREAILAAELAIIEAGFSFTAVLEETRRPEADTALATRPPLAA